MQVVALGAYRVLPVYAPNVELTATFSALTAVRKPGFASTAAGFLLSQEEAPGLAGPRGFSSASEIAEDWGAFSIIQFITTYGCGL